jgi:hypothetical protein
MKAFENWILSRAKKIEQKAINSKKVEIEKSNIIMKMIKEHSKVLLEEIVSNIQKPKWEVGKELYLNVYNSESEFEQLYGWDGGYRALLNLITEDEQTVIPTVVVKSVSVESLWFDELVERFADFRANELDAKDYNVFKARFKSYIDERGLSNPEVKRNLGVYYEVRFEPKTFKFSPHWGLSEYSWIDPASSKSQKVKEVWEKKQVLNKQRHLIEIELKGLEKEIELLEKQIER